MPPLRLSRRITAAGPSDPLGRYFSQRQPPPAAVPLVPRLRTPPPRPSTTRSAARRPVSGSTSSAAAASRPSPCSPSTRFRPSPPPSSLISSDFAAYEWGAQGFDVTGSDIAWNGSIDRLERAGPELRIGHCPMNIQREGGKRVPSALVVSSAIPDDNVEIRHAYSAGVPVYCDLDLAKFVDVEFVWSNW